jgi:hypothetical protein
MRFKRAAAGLVLALCAFGALCCSKSPTGNNGQTITATVTIGNTAALPTLTNVIIAIDGTQFIQNTSATPLATYILSGTEALNSGSHTMTVQVAGQSISPQTYTITPVLQVTDASGNLTNTIAPSGQTLQLATGQSASFPFTI